MKKFKNNKACGDDLVINEYIKSITEKFIELYEKLLNLIFQSGVIPDSWLNGNMKPIYKNKGCKTDPQNIKPIKVLSCLGKVFTSILSERLTQYSVTNLLYYVKTKVGFGRAGADPGFQVRGAHLKKLRRAEGGAKSFGVFRVKNHDFTPKNPILGEAREIFGVFHVKNHDFTPIK